MLPSTLEKRYSDLIFYAETFFSKESNILEINPDNFIINLGFYTKSASLSYPGKRVSESRKLEKLKLPLKYKLLFDIRRVSINLIPNTSSYEMSQVRGFSDFLNRKSLAINYFDLIKIRADYATDNLESLKKAEIINADDIYRLRSSIRHRNFTHNLEKVIPPRKYTHPAVFYSDALYKGTYDKKFNYYKKWKNSDNEYKTFSISDLSDKYLTENFIELKLVKNKYHVLFILDSIKLLYLLEHNSKQDLIVSTPISITGVFKNESPASILTNPSKYKNRKAIFFYTHDGVDKIQDNGFINFPKFNLRMHSNEVVVSPEILVRKAWNEEGENKDVENEIKLWSEWEWFVEMTHIYFSDKSYELDISILLTRPLVPANRNTLFLNEYKKVRDKSKGLIRRELSRNITRYENNPDLYVFPQALPIGRNNKQLLVGMDDSSVYTRYTDIGLTTKIPLDTFFINFTIGSHSKVVFQKTKGLIPFIAIVLAASGGVLGAVLLGSASLVYAFKHFVVDFVFYKVTKPIVRGVKERFYEQMIFTLAYGFAAIFTDHNVKEHRFVLGFLKGLSIDSINSQMNKYKRLVYEGPRYYRWYKLFSRIKASIRLIEKKLEELKSTIDDNTSKLLINRLVDVADHSKNGFLLLVLNLYYLDYKQVQGALNTIGDLSGYKIPTEKEWEKARKEHFKEFLEKYTKIINKTSLNNPETKDEVDNLYKVIQKSLHITHISFDVLSSIKYTGLLIVPTIIGIVGGVGGLSYLGYKDFTENDSKGTNRILSLLFKPFTQFNKYKPNEAEKLGSIIGHVLGTFFINGSIFKEGTRLGRLSGKNKAKKNRDKTDSKKNSIIKRLAKFTKEKAMNEFIKDEFGSGIFMPLMELLFSHYIIVFERIRKDLKGDEKNILENITKEINTMLLGKDHKDYKIFQTKAEQVITFEKALLLLKLFDEKLEESLVEMAEDPLLPIKLNRALAELNTTKIPSFEKIIDFKEPTEWVREALIFIAMSHLHSAIIEIKDAVILMYTPIDKKTGFKIIDILDILGIKVTEDQAKAELLKDMEDLFLKDNNNASKNKNG